MKVTLHDAAPEENSGCERGEDEQMSADQNGRDDRLLTAVVLTKNEERDLVRCLDSLRWAHDVLVVDDCSTDNTIEIAKRYGRVLTRPLRSFAEQRNFALANVATPWTLFLDADEEVPLALAEEIQDELNNPRAICYAIHRRNWFLGQPMGFGGWQGDWQIRLGRTSSGIWHNDVHEQWQFDGTHYRLRTSIEHYGDVFYGERLTKTNQYSSLVARQRFERGARTTAVSLLGRPLWRVARSYVAKQGFRDGQVGLISAIHQFIGEFSIQTKLWELNRSKDEAFLSELDGAENDRS
jgi:glycosyltransferase involved in cell wall biosynthesis